MSAADYAAHSKGAQQDTESAASPYPLWEGVVIDNATSETQKVRVRNPHSAGGDEFHLGYASWVRKTDGVLPKVGDRCLIGLDVTHSPWIVGWLTQTASQTWLPGDLKATARATAPAGWLLCEGQEVLIASYKSLYEALGSHELAGAKFAVPDMRNRALIGSSGTRALGTTGGAATVTISTSTMPKHSHTSSDGNQFLTNAPGGGAVGYAGGGATLTHPASTAEAGGGEAHENMPPYYAGNWLIKT